MSEHTGEDGLLPLLRAGRWYASRDTAPVPGGPLLSLAPEIMIRDDAARLRRERADWRPAVLRAAVELFADAALPIEGLGVQDPDDFAAAMRACAGLPPVLVRRWSDMLRDAAEDPPHGEREEAELALVSLPANTFTCLEGVLEAALTSEAVWIRPSRREPLSAARLVAALLGAGWPAERLGYYPTLPSVVAQGALLAIYLVGAVITYGFANRRKAALAASTAAGAATGEGTTSLDPPLPV